MKTSFCILLLIMGVSFVFGGAWLIWDLMIYSSFHTPYLTPGWTFAYPLFIRQVDSLRWTEPFDVGLTMIFSGMIILSVTSFIFGYYAREKYSNN